MYLNKHLLKNFILFSIFFVFSCSTVPITKRKGIMLISEEEEISLGQKAYEEVLATSKLCTDKKINETIKDIGQKLSQVADKPNYKWEFIVIDDSKTINAFCLPGGKIFFYTGILPLCKDEDGIAVVMGHEIAHAIARHGAERMSQGVLAQLGAQILSGILGDSSSAKNKLILEAYGLSTSLGVMLPFSRKHEYEADYIGLILMSKAGYNPQSAVDFWKRMSELSKDKKIPEFLSTHPSDEKRVEEISKRIPEAMQYYKK